MDSVETTMAAPPHDLLKAALGPYADLVSRLVAGEDGSVGAGNTHVDLAGLQLDHWESTALHAALGENAEDNLSWGPLLLESVAFMVKFDTDAEQMQGGRDSSPRGQAQIRRLLVSNATVGLALMEKCQRTVDSMVLAGEISEAKRLSGFRNKLVQRVSLAKDKVGQDAIAEAEKLSAEMIEPVGPQAPRERAVPTLSMEGEEPKVAKFARKIYAPAIAVNPTDSVSRNFLKPLVISLVVLAAIWAMVVLPKLLDRQRLPVLDQSSFPRSVAFGEILARPPSLFVTVNTAAWGRMDDDARQELVAEVGRTAEGSGYTGAVFRDPDGRTVAQWLKKTGVKILPSPR